MISLRALPRGWPLPPRGGSGGRLPGCQDAPTDLLFDEALRQDLDDLPALSRRASDLQPAAVARRDAIIKAATPNAGQPWDALPALSDSPTAGLRTLAGHLRQQAVTLEESMDMKERAEMEKEYAELRARQELFALKGCGASRHPSIRLAATLGQCVAATATAAISRKSTRTDQYDGQSGSGGRPHCGAPDAGRPRHQRSRCGPVLPGPRPPSS